jgi:hypothetical protein
MNSKHFLQSFLVILILLGPSANEVKAGGILNIIEADFEPLIYTDHGRVNMCGIHFSAALSGASHLFGVQGSLNISFYKNKLPGVMQKMSVVEPINGKLVSHTLTHAFIMKENLSTASFEGQNGEDGASWMSYAFIPDIPVEQMFLFSDIATSSPWVGFNVGVGQDFIFQLPPPSNPDILKQYILCQERGFNQLAEEHNLQ